MLFIKSNILDSELLLVLLLKPYSGWHTANILLHLTKDRYIVHIDIISATLFCFSSHFNHYGMDPTNLT